VLERLAQELGIRWRKDTQAKAEIGQGRIGPVPVILAKPLTYMNLSGITVGALVRRHHIPPEKVIIISDDLSLETGIIKIRARGSAGGHNGHKSIIEFIGSDYPRIKIGIGHPGSSADVVDYVLESFSEDEFEKISHALETAVKGVQLIVTDGIEAAMNRFNRNKSQF
jgi:PTH1 family peptidyl-tRNA hydrolase